MRSFVYALVFALAGCSGGSTSPDDDETLTDTDTTSETDTDTTTDDMGDSTQGPVDVSATLSAAGYTVTTGHFIEYDLANCCGEGATCWVNNPTSPYLAFYLPLAPGQSAPNNLIHSVTGEGAAFHLRADEAIVFFGETPPKAEYFGFTPYLFDRATENGRAEIFASLSEALNIPTLQATLGEDVFARPIVIIVSPDATLGAAIGARLREAGVDPASIVSLPLDGTVGRYGLDEASDTFAVLMRLALVEDPDALADYRADPKATLVRVTPASATTSTPAAPLATRPKGTATEAELATAVDALGVAIAEAYPDYNVQDIVVRASDINPEECIAELTSCQGDTRDTVYMISSPFQWIEPDEILIAYGVNHAATNKATYSSVAVYAVDHLVGVAAVTDDLFDGSAARYIDDPDASLLYAYTLKQTCADDEAYCTEVAVGTCPTGIASGDLALVGFRAYVEPGFATAADQATIVVDRLIKLRPKILP